MTIFFKFMNNLNNIAFRNYISIRNEYENNDG